MYCDNSIHPNDLIANILKVIEKENGPNTEIEIHQEKAFQTDSERKLFYKNHNRSDEAEHIYFNHQTVPTVYSPPNYENF